MQKISHLCRLNSMHACLFYAYMPCFMHVCLVWCIHALFDACMSCSMHACPGICMHASFCLCMHRSVHTCIKLSMHTCLNSIFLKKRLLTVSPLFSYPNEPSSGNNNNKNGVNGSIRSESTISSQSKDFDRNSGLVRFVNLTIFNL